MKNPFINTSQTVRVRGACAATTIALSLALSTASFATVLATPIRFGSSGDSEQKWTADGSSSTYTHTVTGVDGTIDGVAFPLNSRASLTLTVVSTVASSVVKSDGSNKLGVDDEFINPGENLQLKLSVAVESGYRIKTLYMDQLWLDGWGSGDEVRFTDSSGDQTYNAAQEPSFRYSGSPNSGTTNDPTWRPKGSGRDFIFLSDFTPLDTSNVGGMGDNSWELNIGTDSTSPNTGSKFYLNEVHFHYEVEAIPEPTSLALLSLTAMCFILRRAR